MAEIFLRKHPISSKDPPHTFDSKTCVEGGDLCSEILCSERQIGSSVTHTEKIRKIHAKYVCFESEVSRKNAKYQERHAAKKIQNLFCVL